MGCSRRLSTKLPVELKFQARRELVERILSLLVYFFLCVFLSEDES
jgi:hypothetical protein